MDEHGSQEIYHHGQGVSTGVAYGPVYLITSDTLRVPRREIDSEEVEIELGRLDEALAATRADIERVRSALQRADKRDEAAIFDSHLLILEDLTLIESARERIRRDLVNVEHAFSSLVIDAPGDCSPSRRVVSKMISWSAMRTPFHWWRSRRAAGRTRSP